MQIGQIVCAFCSTAAAVKIVINTFSAALQPQLYDCFSTVFSSALCNKISVFVYDIVTSHVCEIYNAINSAVKSINQF